MKPQHGLILVLLGSVFHAGAASAAITLPAIADESGRLHFYASGELTQNTVDSFEFAIPENTIAVGFFVDGQFSEPFTDYSVNLFLNYTSDGESGWGFGSGDSEIGGTRGDIRNPPSALLPAGLWSVDIFHTRPDNTYAYTLEITATPLPEPSTLIVGVSALALLIARRKKS